MTKTSISRNIDTYGKRPFQNVLLVNLLMLMFIWRPNALRDIGVQVTEPQTRLTSILGTQTLKLSLTPSTPVSVTSTTNKTFQENVTTGDSGQGSGTESSPVVFPTAVVFQNNLTLTSTAVSSKNESAAYESSMHATPASVSNKFMTGSTTKMLSDDSDACLNPVYILTDLEGHIVWKSRALDVDCKPNVTWQIQLPPDKAVTLSIKEIIVTDGCQLEFHSLRAEQLPTNLSTETLLRSYTGKRHYEFGFAPLLSYTNHMVITGYMLEYYCVLRFDIRYVAHLRNSKPLKQFDYRHNVRTGSALKYECAPHIPDVLKCDMIYQCLDGEDENNCPYKEDGSCGDWIPHKNYCLKPVFIRGWTFNLDGAETIPAKAEEMCRTKHGATLATLTDTEGLKLVEDMIRPSGFMTATIGLKKVKPVSPKLRHLYRFLWQWGDRGSPVAHNQIRLQRDGAMLDCTMLSVGTGIVPIACVHLRGGIPNGYVCMRENPTRPKTDATRSIRLDFPKPTETLHHFPTKRCRDGSLVQTFHRCLWDGDKLDFTDSDWSESNMTSFHCRFGESIHYTLLCDGKPDCPDASDEVICMKPRFSPLVTTSFVCGGAQTIPASLRCDGMPDCFDGTDEEDCVKCKLGFVFCSGVGCIPSPYRKFFDTCPEMFPVRTWYHHQLPAALLLDGTGMAVFSNIRDCLENEFRCSNGLCIPSFLINNGEQDCLLGEDEHIAKENVTCPGYYRCQYVGLCVHVDNVCDGIHHCPNKDDERYCDLTCPDNCTCEGHAYTCSKMFDPHRHLQVRYLDLSKTHQPPHGNISVMEFLHFLNLSFCQLRNVRLTDMPFLSILDLSFNAISGLSSLNFEKLPGLSKLDLSKNPLTATLDSAFSSFISRTESHHLQILSVAGIGLKSIEDKVFQPLSELETLDVRGNKIESFDKDVFWGLNQLEVLYSDNHKLCCPYFNPPLTQCYAPEDELSSCSDLLRLDFFIVFLWSFSVLAIVGNVGSLIYRLCSKDQKAAQRSSRILLSNLCAADLLMGVYMMLIGSADVYFRGVYVSHESDWKESYACQVAGVLSFVSSEVSAFMICLVTLDRFLTLCFPLKSRLHMNARSSAIVSGVAWLVGVTLAIVPLVAKWEFYGQSGICLPLPITRQQYQGQQYAFGVFIVLNFVVFLFVGLGQACIFDSVYSASAKFGTERRQQEMTMARRLFLIVLTDFLCWFPIGLLGILASQGVPIPGEVNVWAAIFVLPLNSALNPFLYTLNGLAERWAKQKEVTRMQRMMGKLHSEIPSWTPAAVEELTRVCLRSKLVKKERVVLLLGIQNGLKETVEEE